MVEILFEGNGSEGMSCNCDDYTPCDCDSNETESGPVWYGTTYSCDGNTDN